MLALLPVILWGSLANHLSFALAAVPSDPASVWNTLLSQAWIRPWLLQRRITQGLWLATLFFCAWIPALLGHERAWDFALMGVWFSLLAILSLPDPSGRILAARNVVYVHGEGQLWWISANRVQYADLWIPLSRLLPMWDCLPRERKKSVLSTLAALLPPEPPPGGVCCT